MIQGKDIIKSYEDLQVLKGVDIDIIVECPIHGEFEIRPVDHKRKRGCSKRNRRFVIFKFNG